MRQSSAPKRPAVVTSFMPATLTATETEAQLETGDGGFVTLPPMDGDNWGGSGPDAGLVQRYRLGVWIGMGGITMFFAALTSAMVVRQGLSGDWQPFSLPPVLYLSTLVLLMSSFAIERSRREMRKNSQDGLRRWVNVTSLLGLAFLTCQVVGWQELVGRGIYLASNPANSFYYVLTAGHGLHLLGGIAALGYIWARTRSAGAWPTREAAVEAAALYWHFLDVLWIYILGLLLFWR